MGQLRNSGGVDEDTHILTDRGWLTIDEVSIGDLTLGYNPKGRTAHWDRVLAVNIYPAMEREMVEMRTRLHSSLTSAHHRWPIESMDYRVAKTITTAEVNSKSCFYRGAPVSNLPTLAKYEDSFIELIGWFCTEGNVGTSHGKPSNYIKIHQSTVNPENVDRIRTALTSTFGPSLGMFPRTGRTRPTIPAWRESAPTARPQERIFTLNTVAGALLQEAAPNKVMRPDFVASLTASQLDLLWNTWLAGDGNGGDWLRIGQKERTRLEPLQMGLSLRGRGSSLTTNPFGWALQQYNSNRFSMETGVIDHRVHSGRMWCPITESGSWLARREGRTFITGS